MRPLVRAIKALLPIFCLSLLFSPRFSAQNPTSAASTVAGSSSPAKPAPTQDAQALAVLARAATALGGTSLFATNGAVMATISGNSSRGEALNGLKVEDSWSNGQIEFRREVPGAGNLLVSNHGKPRALGSDGSPQNLPAHTGYGIAPFYLPGAVLYNDVADGQHSIKYIGDTTIDGTPVAHIRIWNGGDLLHAVQSAQDWYFDSATGLPVRVEHRSADPTDGVKFLKFTTDYKTFATVSGVFTATGIVEYSAHGGKVTSSITSLTLVPSLASTEFEIGGAQ